MLHSASNYRVKLVARVGYNALVVQLVRTLPCHGRGRGFESHRARKVKKECAFAHSFFTSATIGWDEESRTKFCSEEQGDEAKRGGGVAGLFA